MKNKKYYLFKMNMKMLNIISLLLFAFMLILTLVLYYFKVIHNPYYSTGLIFILMIPYLVLHELLHSLAYVLHGADFKNITYGAHLEQGILCCLCKQNISRNNILISLMYPFIFIGVFTYVIGIIFDIPILIALSVINISGCSGDLMMYYALRKIKNFEYSEYDDPIAFGLYTDEDLSKKKLFALDYVGSRKELDRTITKKVTISKVSIILFIVIILIGLFYMFV